MNMELEEGKEIEPVQDKLDVEYRQILRIIKPYIQTINNNTYLAQYRIWLEKLSETKENEKFVRNQYLMELARQIQCKHLASPFTQSPPRGALPPLRGPQWNTEETNPTPFDEPLDVTDPYLTKQRMCQQWTEENESNMAMNRLQWPYHTCLPRSRRQSHPQLTAEQQLREAQRCIKRSATSVKKISLLNDIDEQTRGKLAEVAEIGRSSPARSPTRPFRAQPISLAPAKDLRIDLEVKKRLQNPSLAVIHEDHPDMNEESWCDLTEASNTSITAMASGDTDKEKDRKATQQQGEQFEQKINTLMIEINGLKRKSDKMNEKCENTLKAVQETISPSSTTSTKQEMKGDDGQKNTSNSEGSFITTDWKKIVESLQVRLSETQHQNRELNALTSTLHKKIKELDSSKEQVRLEIRRQILEEQRKEIEKLKASHERKLKELVEGHDKKLKETAENYERRKVEAEKRFEGKIKEIEEKYAKTITEKNSEITRLEDIVQKECLRLVNEITVLRTQIEEASHTNTTNDERILFLQKCITKMDRLFQKSEREYCKQIEKLKQELDNRDKAIQIQLQTQKAEVISRCSAEKQTELDMIVQNLESKYTHLLEMQQGQINLIKCENHKIINELKTKLDQHNIPY